MRRWTPWSVSASVVLATVGCSGFQTTQQTKVNVAPNAMPAVARADKLKDQPKRQPQSTTCLRAAQCFEEVADRPDTTAAARAGGYEQARRAYQQALELSPKNKSAILGLARLYEKEGKWEVAVSGYKEGLKHYPNDAALWFSLSMCWARQKRWQPAIECMNKAVALEPTNTNYSNYLGWTLARAGKYDESLQHFHRTVGEARAHYNVALMMQHLGHEDACRENLYSALRKDPDLSEARTLLATLDGRRTPTP